MERTPFWGCFTMVTKSHGPALASVVVILKLMPHRQDHHVGGVLDLVQGNVACPPKRDHQLSKKRTVCGLAVDERRAAEVSLDGILDRINSDLRRIKVLGGTCPLQQEVEQPQQVVSGRVGVPNLK